MTAVVRLKRHFEDEPVSALMINCKRQKTDDGEEEKSAVLKFAGTLKEEDDVSSHISKLSKKELEESYKKYVPNTTTKLRQFKKESSENNRYKVVSMFRSTSEENDEKTETTPITVLNVEPEKNQSSETDADEFVYDLYYADTDNIFENENDAYYVCPANEVIFHTGSEDIESLDDSDDSNAENNWKNDYPDEDDFSIDEDDIREAVEKLSIGEDLSSEDEGIMYSIDSETIAFEEDVDDNDVRRYGEMYARFKARQKKEEEKYNKDLYHEEYDDTDEDFY